MSIRPTSRASCPHCGEPLPAELLVEAVAALAMARPLSERMSARRAELRSDVAVLLALDPTITANAVARSLARRRTDVLEVVRELRERERQVPRPGNHASARKDDRL